jgi:cytochrome c biogenesis factor
MNIDPSAGSLGLLAVVKPMVAWIWGATVMMAVGGLIALVPPRRSAALSVRVEPAPVIGGGYAATAKDSR